MREGRGTQIWTDGSKYVGEWKENRAWGYGKFQNQQNNSYEGDWVNNRAHGYGIFINKDNEKY